MNPNPLEKIVEAKIGQYAKSKGCLWKKWSSPGQRGVPDRIIVTPAGVVGFLELKREGQTPSPLQTSELRALKKHGACVGWCDNVEDGCEFIDELLKHQATFQVIIDAGWFQTTT